MNTFSIVFTLKDSKELFEYLDKIGIKDEKDACIQTGKLIDVGLTVMNTMQTSNDVKFVKNEIDKLILIVGKEVDNFSSELNKSIDNVLNTSFNIDIDSSIMGKTKIWLREQLASFQKDINTLKDNAEKTGKLIIENAQKVSSDKLSIIESGISEANQNFNPDDSTSYLGKLRNEVSNVQDEIKKFLDFNRTDSFSYKMQNHLETFFGKELPILEAVKSIVIQQQDNINVELIKLREEIAHKEGSSEMLDKTAIKGFIFEDKMEQMLFSYAEPFGDIVTRTSLITKAGDSGKKGDFIYELNNSDNRIVIEAKDVNVVLKPMITYMKEAMEFRECNFSILCTRILDQLPNQVGYFNLYEGNKLFCSFEFLPFAIRWVKLYMERIQLTKDAEGIDADILKDKIEQIRNSLKAFVNIKTQLTNIDKVVGSNTDEIRDLLSNIFEDINKSLSELEQ